VCFFRPGSLLSLESGVWVVDEFQPVAAIIDSGSGDILNLVSWPEVPAASRLVWPGPALMSDGSSVWAQQERSGPLLRIGSDGSRSVAWTDGMQLAACGAGEAWCMSAPPNQELVQGADAQPMALADFGLSTVLRVGADRRQDRLMVNRPVRALHATADALVIEVDDDPWQLHHLGVDTYEVVRTSRYLPLPWGTDLPVQLVVTADTGSQQQPTGIQRPPSDLSMTWYEQTEDPCAQLHATGLRWRLGRTWQEDTQHRSPWLPVLVTAHDDDDNIVRRFDLGPGNVVTARSIAGDTAVAVAIARPGPGHPVELLSLSPAADTITTLLGADSVDITEVCWPLVPRPIEADSYAAQILARNSSLQQYWHGDDGVQPLAGGMSEVTTRLDGQWPDTRLEWTFHWTHRPGLTLRRRVPLYDELGRLAPPEYADIHLMERLHTGAIPVAATAHHGILDI